MADDEEIFKPGGGFGRYQIERQLGEGGMCVVWQGRHRGLGKLVAIKVLKSTHAKNPGTRGRFLREGEAIARIRHANVVEVHDVGTVDDQPYLVMEFLEGEDLRSYFLRRGPLSPHELADIMVPVCSAVAAAHDERIIHRDLKPENIFLSRTRDRGVVPKVLDFGISRISNDSGRLDTGTSAFMGTPRYMSPEQTQGAKHVDERSDQYSLGVILYQGATGKFPIDEPVLLHLLQRIVAGQFEPPRALRPELPPAFEQTILRAMATVPAHRFANVRDLCASLLPYAGERVRVLHGDATASPNVEPSESFTPSYPPPISPTAPMTEHPFGVMPSAIPPASLPPALASQPPPEWHTTLGASAREVPTNPLPRKRSRSPRIALGLALMGLLAMFGVVLILRSTSGTPPSVAAAVASPPHLAPPTPSRVVAPAAVVRSEVRTPALGLPPAPVARPSVRPPATPRAPLPVRGSRTAVTPVRPTAAPAAQASRTTPSARRPRLGAPPRQERAVPEAPAPTPVFVPPATVPTTRDGHRID